MIAIVFTLGFFGAAVLIGMLLGGLILILAFLRSFSRAITAAWRQKS